MNQNVKYGLFFLGGVALGALGAVVVTRGKLDVKPLATNLISGGIDLREKALAAVESVKEDIADVVAEAQVKSQEKREAARSRCCCRGGRSVGKKKPAEAPKAETPAAQPAC